MTNLSNTGYTEMHYFTLIEAKTAIAYLLGKVPPMSGIHNITLVKLIPCIVHSQSHIFCPLTCELEIPKQTEIATETKRTIYI